MSTPTTYVERVIARHTVTATDDQRLLEVDVHLLHEVSSPQAFEMLRDRDLPVRAPARNLGVIDHIVSTAPGRTGGDLPGAGRMIDVFRANTAGAGVELVDIDDDRHGIVHVVASESGAVRPGQVVVCGDSHTCTLGALGAVAWGIGTSEVAHVLATQAVWFPAVTPRGLRLVGRPGPHTAAKDVILRACGVLGPGWGRGHTLEMSGPYVDGLAMSGRFTLCNMAIELGARVGVIPPDETTLAYVGAMVDADEAAAVRALATELTAGARPPADTTELDVDGLGPQVTWGTTLADVVGVDGRVPDGPGSRAEADFRNSLAYQGLAPGQPVAEIGIDHAFLGSCTNSRLDDLAAAATVARGHRVHPGVNAVVVPGSQPIARAAERAGYRAELERAGFAWREPGCSSCVAVNGEVFGPGERVVASSNRNFEGRQGAGARTHLASPATVVASAVLGRLAGAGDLDPALAAPGPVAPVEGGRP